MLCVAPNCSSVVCYWWGLCQFAPKCFSTIFEVFPLYAKMCIISHAPTMKQRIRLRFTDHSRIVGHCVCVHSAASNIEVAHRFWKICGLLIYGILTYFMEQGPSREANRFSDSRDIPHILWIPRCSSTNPQMIANWPYPQTHRSNLCPHIPLPEDHS